MVRDCEKLKRNVAMHIDNSTVVLGIESSCDETAAAIVMGGNDVLSSVVSSQIDIHAKFGGVCVLCFAADR